MKLNGQMKVWEGLLRDGHGRQVKKQISTLNLKKITRLDAMHVANLARRLRLSNLSLKILSPIVRNDK